MNQPPNRLNPLATRAQAEVERRAWSRHQANITAWAMADEGSLPTLEQAREEELRTTELLLRGLEHLALHAPREVFLEAWPWDSWFPDE